MECDVLVVGGGSAGVAAAVTAARAGASTVLLERHGSLGGMAAASLVHSICGLYLLRTGPGVEYANDGFPVEFAQRLIDDGGAWGPRRMGKVDVLLQHPTAFATLCDTFVGEQDHLTLRLHTEVTAAHHHDAGHVQRVNTICRGITQTLHPGAVVDASGDGTIAAMLGHPGQIAPADKLQRPAFVFSLLGIAPGVLDKDGRIRLATHLARAVRQGDLPEGVLGASFHATGRSTSGGEAFVTIDLTPPEDGKAEVGRLKSESQSHNTPAFRLQNSAFRLSEYNPTDPACLTALETHGRSLAATLARFLQTHAPGFEDARIASFPGRVGVRESRRLTGQYELTADDLRRGARFDDAVARASWPIELRETNKGPRLRYPEDHRPCDIPLRCLRVAGLANLYTAGRCISCDHEAQASIRVMGTCMATGQAAGAAAALLAKDGQHPDVDRVRQALQTNHQDTKNTKDTKTRQ